MAKLKIFVQKSKIAASFWIGAILILTGIIISVYVDSVIKVHEEKLFFWNLPDGPEKWAIEGSWEWWRMAKITIYDPISIIIIAIGLIALIYSFFLAIKQRS
jgi:hypothetical protein